MRKIGLIAVALVAMITVGCTSQTGASSESETYLESVDEYSRFNAMKLVDKESGCKYLITRSPDSGQMTSTQMFDSDGKPLCNSVN